MPKSEIANIKTPLVEIGESMETIGTFESPQEQPIYQTQPSKLKKLFKKLFGKSEKKLGTIMGVLIPNILNIFGVILFLRLGMIVGQAGLWISILMFSIAYFVVLMTTLSLSAISTNGSVKGGGAYYLISRSLGPEFGGSIGVLFYLGNVAAGALYTIGFSDSLVQAFQNQGIPSGHWFRFLFGSVALWVLTFISFVGADLFAKTSLLIFVVLMIAIFMGSISFAFQKSDTISGYTNWKWDTFVGNFAPSFVESKVSGSIDFRQLFGILFPACTGIMAGVNMSGDLQNAAKSIPSGTLSAVGITYVVYIGLCVLLSATTMKQALIHTDGLMSHVSFVPILVSIGIWAATLSSALSSIIGGARILQALSRDRLLPFMGILGKGFGKNDEPRIAVLLTFFLIQVCIIIGKLDLVAPIQTVFFVLSYGFTNFACFALSVTGAPNWRPSFTKFSWLTALMGTIMCFVIMFLVNPIAAGIAIAIQLVLMVIIHFYSPTQPWGDITQAFMYFTVRKYLLRLDVKKDHVKYWRPQALLLIANPKSAYPLIQFVNNLKKGGLYVIGHTMVGNFDENRNHLTEQLNAWEELIRESKIKAFPNVTNAPSVREGIQNLILTSGLGGMRPNTIIYGFYDRKLPKKNSDGWGKEIQAINLFPPLRTMGESSLPLQDYVHSLIDSRKLGKAIMIARHFSKMNKRLLAPSKIFQRVAKVKDRYIDLWPLKYSTVDQFNPNVNWILQYGFIINRVGVWNKFHRLRLCSIVLTPQAIDPEISRLKELLHRTRISAEVVVISLMREDFSMFDDLNLDGGNAAIYGRLALREKYMLVNSVISRNSEKTSLIFMSLPDPPENTMEADCQQYIEELEILSDNLPPTMMVRSDTNVISLEV